MPRITERGYMGKILRIDLTTGTITVETPDETALQKYIGGSGLGLMYLYKEVPPGVEWSDPENRLMAMSGPLGGTVGGTGTYSLVTKGSMTNGAASTQANGFWGAFIKLSGFDGIIIQGKANEWVYVYIHDGSAEIKDARHLLGKNTLETQQTIEKELGIGLKNLSSMTIGPAGENLVRFASVVSDRGHVAAHNGVGAVMGSKKLKAIAVSRGSSKIFVQDKKRLINHWKRIMKKTRNHPLNVWQGTTSMFIPLGQMGLLPVKNYTSAEWLEYKKLDGTYYRKHFRLKRKPCWACPLNHCHSVTLTEGPYKDFVGDEPEYEAMAAMGPLIGNKDPAAAVVLSNEVDWLGLDINETGWMIAWLMECFEENLITKQKVDGLELRWGTVETARQIIRKIAYREGIGNMLAEGVMRAAKEIGGEAAKRAIFTESGNSPRTHDHRTIWNTLLDTSISSIGTDEVSALLASPESLGLPKETDRGTAKGAALLNAAAAKVGLKHLYDSLPLCYLATYGSSIEDIMEFFKAATGWGANEIRQVGFRVNNLFRAFNLRHGWTPDMDRPSSRYGSTSLNGEGKGKSILLNWDEARKTYYEAMGWDRETGKPLPDTLKELGLEFVIQDLWP